MNVSIEDIRQAIHTLNLSGRVVDVHSSLRSFGFVEGGGATVVQAFLDERCTILVPTFSWDAFHIPAPPGMRPPQNGYNYELLKEQTPGMHRIYTPGTLEIDKDMGAIPAMVLSLPDRIRGNHPLCSFSAVGPDASGVIAAQEPLHVFAPLEKLVEVNGSVLMIGIGLTSMTLIHFAEQEAGRNLFRRWANGPDGQPIEVETGGCSEGFEQFEPSLRQCEQRLFVGQSLWRIFPAKTILEIATKAIQEYPQITHCANPECERCNDAVRDGPILTTSS